LEIGLKQIEKLIRSKHEVFAAGKNSLQAYCARSIQSYLHIVVHDGRKRIDASERAAESQGFATKWGGRLVRQWAQIWIKPHRLPMSCKGQHMKAFTLLSDPVICTELCAFVRSHKWAICPEKLAEFSKTNLVPAAVKDYLRQAVEREMPRGLKKYMEVELFPRIHLKVGKGISLRTARRWLHREGFRYIEHKKLLYYNGHERPDVVQYRQDVFLPAMEKYCS
jgi:hypothetical protein